MDLLKFKIYLYFLVYSNENWQSTYNSFTIRSNGSFQAKDIGYIFWTLMKWNQFKLIHPWLDRIVLLLVAAATAISQHEI